MKIDLQLGPVMIGLTSQRVIVEEERRWRLVFHGWWGRRLWWWTVPVLHWRYASR